jgi:hypothetical protein
MCQRRRIKGFNKKQEKKELLTKLLLIFKKVWIRLKRRRTHGRGGDFVYMSNPPKFILIPDPLKKTAV